jgi:hypothetical protein
LAKSKDKYFLNDLEKEILYKSIQKSNEDMSII